MPAMLQLAGVTKSFQGTRALGPETLNFEAGSTTAVIGPSGCGKSTLLRLIIGLIRPDEGEIRVADEALTPDTVLAMRQRIGYVIQDGGLFPHLSARDNVTLMARYLRWPRQRIDARLEALADMTRFPREGLSRYPGQLSGGQRQRVSLMRALCLEPDVLLLDEPLAALDPMVRADLQSDLREIFRRYAKTVVLVTHDIGEAAYFADSIVLLRAGRVVQRGALEDLVMRPAEAFVRDFVNAQRTPLESLRGTSQ